VHPYIGPYSGNKTPFGPCLAYPGSPIGLRVPACLPPLLLGWMLVRSSTVPLSHRSRTIDKGALYATCLTHARAARAPPSCGSAAHAPRRGSCPSSRGRARATVSLWFPRATARDGAPTDFHQRLAGEKRTSIAPRAPSEDERGLQRFHRMQKRLLARGHCRSACERLSRWAPLVSTRRPTKPSEARRLPIQSQSAYDPLPVGGLQGNHSRSREACRPIHAREASLKPVASRAYGELPPALDVVKPSGHRSGSARRTPSHGSHTARLPVKRVEPIEHDQRRRERRG